MKKLFIAFCLLGSMTCYAADSIEDRLAKLEERVEVLEKNNQIVGPQFANKINVYYYTFGNTCADFVKRPDVNDQQFRYTLVREVDCNGESYVIGTGHYSGQPTAFRKTDIVLLN